MKVESDQEADALYIHFLCVSVENYLDMEEGVTIDLGVDGHTLVVEAGEDEGVYLGDFNIDKIRAYRERETWGNAYRKTGSYGPLTSLDVQDPFIRPKVR